MLRPCNKLQWQRFLADLVNTTTNVVTLAPTYITNTDTRTFAFQNVNSGGWLIDAAPVVAAGASSARQLNGGAALLTGTKAAANEQWKYVP